MTDKVFAKMRSISVAWRNDISAEDTAKALGLPLAEIEKWFSEFKKQRLANMGVLR